MQLLRAADKNRDDKITVDEFEALVADMFAVASPRYLLSAFLFFFLLTFSGLFLLSSNLNFSNNVYLIVSDAARLSATLTTRPWRRSRRW